MQFNSKQAKYAPPWYQSFVNPILIKHSFLDSKLGAIITWKTPQFSTEDKVSQSRICKVRLQKHAEESCNSAMT